MNNTIYTTYVEKSLFFKGFLKSGYNNFFEPFFDVIEKIGCPEGVDINFSSLMYILLISPLIFSGLVIYYFCLFMTVGIKFLIERHPLKAAEKEINELVLMGSHFRFLIFLLLLSPVMLSGLIIYSLYLFMAVCIKFLIVRHSSKAAKDQIDIEFKPFLLDSRLNGCQIPLSDSDRKYLNLTGYNLEHIELRVLMREIIYGDNPPSLRLELPDTYDGIIREQFCEAMKNNGIVSSVIGEPLLCQVKVRKSPPERHRNSPSIDIDLRDREQLSTLIVFFKIVFDPNFDYDVDLIIGFREKATDEQKLQFITFLQAQYTYFFEKGLAPQSVLPMDVQQAHLLPLLGGRSFLSGWSETSSVDAVPSTAGGAYNVVTSKHEPLVPEESPRRQSLF